MIYGLYLSATGVLTNSYRQDVIANNLANSETVGFKRDVPLFRQRLTASQENRLASHEWSNDLLEAMGGGTFASPVSVDTSQGDPEQTGTPTDVAIEGKGFFAVRDKGQLALTRDGRFSVSNQGRLVMNASGNEVLGADGKAIEINGRLPIAIGADGTITQNGAAVGRIGLFDVADPAQLRKHGGSLLTSENLDFKQLSAGTGRMRSSFYERSNVEPSTELTTLMDAQRQLEANANMIRYQDQTLGRLVNDVGKIG